MKKATIEFWLSVPELIIAVLSCVGNAYVFHNSRKVQKRITRETNDYIIFNLIQWLSFFDFFWVIAFALNFVPTAFKIAEYTSDECVIIGMMNQFFGLLSSIWHVLIATDFWYLLSINTFSNAKHFFITDPNAKRRNKNKKDKKSNNLTTATPGTASSGYSWLVSSNNTSFDSNSERDNLHVYHRTVFILVISSVIIAVTPYLIDPNSSYSHFANYYDKKNNGYGSECWLYGYWQLIAYSLILLSLLFHYIMLIIIVVKYCQTKEISTAYKFLIKRIFPWIATYSIIRVIPTICRVWSILIDVKTIPLWLVISHHDLLTAAGIGNAIAWYFSRKVKLKRPMNTKKQNKNKNRSKDKDKKKKNKHKNKTSLLPPMAEPLNAEDAENLDNTNDKINYDINNQSNYVNSPYDANGHYLEQVNIPIGINRTDRLFDDVFSSTELATQSIRDSQAPTITRESGGW